MEPFYHPPPPSPARDLSSPHTPPRRRDLQAVTHEWLSLTVDAAPATPPPSLSATPVPPTPPPLPADLAPFLREPYIPYSKEDISRLPLSPPPRSSVTSPLPDSALGNSRGLSVSERSHAAKPREFFRTPAEPVTPPSRFADVELRVEDPYDELLSMVLDVADRTDHRGASRLAPEYPTPLATSKGGVHVKADQATPAGQSAGRARYHKPVTVQVPYDECQRPPSGKGKALIELFIEEEDEAREEEEDVFTGRLGAQVEHM
ncbi:uncharacterized protein [Nerophis lumbriciformis]|uniref:uncharacterized protein n=1 Tax=Nerophis lumbriciformis TaxID=546530 RepID=UPI002ADF58FC|nr:uncharacterized protein LOC133621767 [Nerophis lumbriciformis]